jgi:hypothetical protein
MFGETGHGHVQLWRNAIVIVMCLLLGIAAIFLSSERRSALASSETRFVEQSESGLYIVPASCPSDPHYSGECTPTGGGCTISASPSSIQSGQASLLTWNVADQQGVAGVFSSPANISISSVGSVGQSGTVTVHPSQSTTYTLSGTYTLGGAGNSIQTGSFSCSATVSVDSADTCPAGTELRDGVCVRICPAGQHASGNICLCDATNEPPNSAGLCTQQACPEGFQFDSVSGQCVAVQQCSLPPVCSDETHALNQCTGITTNCVAVYGAGWSCLNGVCVEPPRPIASISAVPRLIRRGDTVNVAWTSSNTESCTVTGTNGDGGEGWTGRNGSRTSSAIFSQVVYTLVCQGLDDSIVTRRDTVNIIPIVDET